MSDNRLKFKEVKMIWESDFSQFVSEVYGRPYRLQQQGDCYAQDSIIQVTANPDDEFGEPYGDEITLEKWLARDVNEPVKDPRFDMYEELREKYPDKGYDKMHYEEFQVPGTWDHKAFWEREFYPPLEELVADLCKKGLLDPGNYVIHIWW